MKEIWVVSVPLDRAGWWEQSIWKQSEEKVSTRPPIYESESMTYIYILKATTRLYSNKKQ